MTVKIPEPNFGGSRRPSRLGDKLAQHKIDEAQKLTPEQRLLIALKLSDSAAALHHACSNKP